MTPSTQNALPKSTEPLSFQAFIQLPIISDIIHCFQSVQLAVILLSLLAIGTLIGVITPQEGTIDVEQIKQQLGLEYGFYNTLGFTHVFSSFWYITLQVLFFFNLLIGSFKWLKRATLAAFEKGFIPITLLALKPEATSLPFLIDRPLPQAQQSVIQVLKKAGYTVHVSGNTMLYACKGNITRLGPHLAHIGILLCLVASLYGTFTGFKAQKLVLPESPIFDLHHVDMFKPNMTPERYWMGQVQPWKIGAKNLKIHYYPNGSPQQYFSDVSIYDAADTLLAQKTISVNDPLVYQNFYIYQATYAPSGNFFISLNNRPLKISLNNQFNQRPVSIMPIGRNNSLIMLPFFAGQDEGVKKNFAVFVLKAGEANPKQMPPNIRLEEGQSGQLGPLKLRYEGPEYAPGLQLKSAPEIPWMYTSFIIIGIGAFLSFFSQRQIWLAFRQTEEGNRFELTMAPKTNKGWFSFRKELYQLQANLYQQLKPKTETTTHA